MKLPEVTDDGTALVGPEKDMAKSIAKKLSKKLPRIIVDNHDVSDEGNWCEEVWKEFSELLSKEEIQFLNKNPAWIRYCIFEYCELPEERLADLGRELLCTYIAW